MPLYGGIEAGGTKFVCAIGSSPDDIRATIRFPTTHPAESLRKACDFFRHYMREQHVTLDGIGIGSFGPLDLNPNSSDYGKITSTPKQGWAFTDVRGAVEAGTEVRTAIDTDVNAAALGEGLWGAAQGLTDFVYLTIGTGIGGGLIIDGKPYHGLVHPEMGHIALPHDLQRDPFPGNCPYHQDCFEGLASGPALEARWGQPAKTLPEAHPAWELEAHYIALGLQNIICVGSPQRIILGGGVMEQHQLFALIRQKVQTYLDEYIHTQSILTGIDDYIVPPGLGGKAGVLGSIALAMLKFGYQAAA